MQQDIISLKANLPYYLQSRGVDVGKAARSNTACPVCGNGTKTGCFHYYPEIYAVKCFSCGFYGDLFDLIAKERGITNAEAIVEVRKMYGGGAEQPQPAAARQEKAQNAAPSDYTDFLFMAEKSNNYEYLMGRGISSETQRRFHIGFVPDWRSPQAVATAKAKGGKMPPSSPRCIIPRTRYNYLARDTREYLTDMQKKFAKQNAGKTSLFNAVAIKDDIFFAVEGEIDAMSIVEAGGNACAICSVANRQLLVNALKDDGGKGKAVIIMLDNDQAGRQGQAEIEKGLKTIGIAYIVAEYPKGIKDPNEWLMTDREGFKKATSFYKAQAKKALEKNQKGNSYNAADLLDYFRNIEQQPKGFETKTGFADLDKHLCGGIHEGLYIIGAVSSLGKTTFALQLADQIAARGQDIIFFSLEMSKYELIAKSLSRHTYQLAGNKMTGEGENEKPLARDTQQILNNRRYKSYSGEEKAIITAAINAYSTEAPHIFIYEGRYKGERLKVSHIRDIVRNHIQTTGRSPIVFVDYLQIIAPADPHATDKQSTDANVFELKEISRDFQIPVFAVSSFNRDNYQEPVSMASFKESGAIEYSSDVLFGLQYAGMDYRDGESGESRKKRLRELIQDIFDKKKERKPIVVDLKCLKNRTGYQFSLAFEMMPAYNHFVPMDDLSRAVHEQDTAAADAEIPDF